MLIATAAAILFAALSAAPADAQGKADGCYCACAYDVRHDQKYCEQKDFCEDWCGARAGPSSSQTGSPSTSWSQQVMNTAAQTGHVDPQAAGMALALDALSLLKSGSSRQQAEAGLAARQRAEQARLAQEAAERKDRMYENLAGKLKTDSPAAGGRFDDDARVVGGLRLKTGENDSFPGLRKERGPGLLANLKTGDEKAKKDSDNVAALKVSGAPTEFEKLTERYKLAKEVAESAEAELEQSRKRLAERRAELKKRREELEKRKKEAPPIPKPGVQKPPATEAPKPSVPDAPKPAPEPAKDEEAERLLRELEADEKAHEALTRDIGRQERGLRDKKAARQKAAEALGAHLQKESKGSAAP